MIPIRAREDTHLRKWRYAIGAGAFILGLAYFLAGKTMKSVVDAALIAGAGLLGVLTLRRTKGQAVAEYNHEIIHVHSVTGIGAEAWDAVSLSGIIRFQQSEPGVVEIYFRDGENDTCFTLDGHPEDVAVFQKFVSERNSKL